MRSRYKIASLAPRCLAEYGKEADAKQVVNDCMIGKVFSEGPAGEKQPVDAKRVLDLRAIFCIDYHKPECEDAICDCNSKCADAAAEDQCKYKPNDLEFCVRDEEPNCIKDEGSLCSQAVVQCLGEFGKETDVDQAVHDCIIGKVISGTPEVEEAPAEPSQETVVSSACKKASAEYQVAVIEADCDEIEDGRVNKVQRRGAASLACQKRWKENNCESELIGPSQALG
ncbi:hypothetical protein MY8738_009226 [Beauveria namnaoensis]